jgi:hypothetical protein
MAQPTAVDPWTCVASGGIPTLDGKCIAWGGKSPPQIQCELTGGAWVGAPANLCVPAGYAPPGGIDPYAQVVCTMMGGAYNPLTKSCATAHGAYPASALVPKTASGPALGPTPTPGHEYTSVLEQRADGLWYFRPEAKAAAENVLLWSVYQPISGTDQRIAVMRLMDEGEAKKFAENPSAVKSAGLWLDTMKKAGRIVYAPPYIAAPVPGREIGYLDPTDDEGIRQTATMPQIAAILAYPDDDQKGVVGRGGLFSRLGLVGIGVAVVVGIAGVALLASKKNQYRANKKKRRIRRKYYPRVDSSGLTPPQRWALTKMSPRRRAAFKKMLAARKKH